MMAASIAISTPIPTVPGPLGKRLGMITVEWQRARMALSTPTGHTAIELRIDGEKIDKARCLIAEKALEVGVKYLFFLDWDVLVPPETLSRLVYLAENNLDYSVVAGLYCTKSHPSFPLIWRGWDKGTDYDWTVGDILDCVGVPAGCTLFRVSDFPDVEKPWFKTDGGTEDLWFCKRAVEAGKKIMLDTGIQCGHINHDTGEVFVLQQDTLPWKRWREQHARRN